jgi:hypothetical protein
MLATEGLLDNVGSTFMTDALMARRMRRVSKCIRWKLWQTHQPYDEAYHLQQRLKPSHTKFE